LWLGALSLQPGGGEPAGAGRGAIAVTLVGAGALGGAAPVASVVAPTTPPTPHAETPTGAAPAPEPEPTEPPEPPGTGGADLGESAGPGLADAGGAAGGGDDPWARASLAATPATQLATLPICEPRAVVPPRCTPATGESACVCPPQPQGATP
jgi:hypothetical protein